MRLNARGVTATIRRHRRTGPIERGPQQVGDEDGEPVPTARKLHGSCPRIRCSILLAIPRIPTLPIFSCPSDGVCLCVETANASLVLRSPFELRFPMRRNPI